jgi:hypothetical protein
MQWLRGQIYLGGDELVRRMQARLGPKAGADHRRPADTAAWTGSGAGQHRGRVPVVSFDAPLS